MTVFSNNLQHISTTIYKSHGRGVPVFLVLIASQFDPRSLTCVNAPFPVHRKLFDVLRTLIILNKFNATLFGLDILIKQSLRIFLFFPCAKYFIEVNEEQAIYFGGFKKSNFYNRLHNQILTLRLSSGSIAFWFDVFSPMGIWENITAWLEHFMAF